MGWEFAVWATVLVPLLGSFTLPLAGLASKPLRNAWAVVLGAATVGFACSLLPAAFSGETHVFNAAMGLGMELTLVVDGLSVFMAIASSLISTLIIVYSLGYIKDYHYQQEYFMMVVLFLGAMMGLVFSANLILMYVFWEITGICSWRLIGFFRDRDVVVKADKAFLTTFGGAVFMLVGFAMVYAQSGTFNLLEMRGLPISGLAVALIAAGIFAKSATLPFHTWLPDAGVAPTPVTALLHAAVLVKIGVYAFARIFNFTFSLSAESQQWLMVFGLLSAMVAAAAALWDTNIKRILAYSTVSQIGYIFMGLAAFNTVGVAGAILFILMHGLAKGGLFLAAGVIEHGTGTKDITRMGGLIKAMPVTAVAVLACIFSIVGIPPFGGFFSKLMVVQGVVKSGNIAIASLAMFTAVLTAVYLLRLFTMVFLGQPRDGSIHAHREGTPSMVWVVAVLAVLSLAAGLLVQYPMDLTNIAVRDILGNPAVHDIMGALR
ncbi:MAG: NADH-quinone oxidoreductase subunit L [Rhodocyclaceae bacterium]|nr:NADH-quinone oxidoreductase subunit L [Rhodocyclaceae bacterium]